MGGEALSPFPSVLLCPPQSGSLKAIFLPSAWVCSRGEQGLTGVGGFKGRGKAWEPWCAGGCCLRGISLSAIDLPLSESRNMYGAEILINPCSAADRSAAAQGLLSKVAGDAKRSCRIWA